jgi:hypothetical protein
MVEPGGSEKSVNEAREKKKDQSQIPEQSKETKRRGEMVNAMDELDNYPRG